MTAPEVLLYDTDADLLAFSTTRNGGIGQGNYARFNINEYAGDEPAAVKANRDALCRWLGIDADRLIYAHQVHGTEVCHITTDFLYQPLSMRRQLLEGVDALMTDVPGVCIGVSTADCIPVILHDTGHRAVSVVHSGWRGTVADIVGKTLCAMREAFGTRVEHLQCRIGPGISLKNFEVGDEVFEQFKAAGFDTDAIACRMSVMSDDKTTVAETDTPKWHIDLPACICRQLEVRGIQAYQWQVSPVCTYENVETFFSARRLGIGSGRIFTGAMLRRH